MLWELLCQGDAKSGLVSNIMGEANHEIGDIFVVHGVESDELESKTVGNLDLFGNAALKLLLVMDKSVVNVLEGVQLSEDVSSLGLHLKGVLDLRSSVTEDLGMLMGSSL